MMNFNGFLRESINKIKKQNLYRQRIILDKDIIDFSSNDYLGLKNEDSTKKLLVENIEYLSLGSGASTHISGYKKVQEELEQFISSFKQTEGCIVVGSGYMANVGLIPAITTEEDIIFSDELNHASIIDGIRLSKAKKVIYKHNNIDDLYEKIKASKNYKNIFIITDGVFSMEGDIAKLDKIFEIAEKYNAVVVIDDAHSTGILGGGRGTLFHYNLQVNENIIQMGTLSKAVGSYGAFICGTNTLIEFLINKMRSAIFTTALSPIQNFISLQNLKIIQNQPHRIEKVLKKSRYLAGNLIELGYNIKHFGTPIITLITQTPEKALKYRDLLLKEGFFVQAIRPPTVPEGESRLRITVSYKHSKIDIENLIYAFKKLKGV